MRTKHVRGDLVAVRGVDLVWVNAALHERRIVLLERFKDRVLAGGVLCIRLEAREERRDVLIARCVSSGDSPIWAAIWFVGICCMRL